ncbi:MAG: hypothetical protein RBT13_05520 [Bacteroidales bacterium]|nr:hypothetical protein [Bacteroidales bacterium]
MKLYLIYKQIIHNLIKNTVLHAFSRMNFFPSFTASPLIVSLGMFSLSLLSD